MKFFRRNKNRISIFIICALVLTLASHFSELNSACKEEKAEYAQRASELIGKRKDKVLNSDNNFFTDNPFDFFTANNNFFSEILSFEKLSFKENLVAVHKPNVPIYIFLCSLKLDL